MLSGASPEVAIARYESEEELGKREEQSNFEKGQKFRVEETKIFVNTDEPHIVNDS